MNKISMTVAFMLFLSVTTILCSVVYLSDKKQIQQATNKQF